MPHIHSKASKPATAALVLLLASLVLVACGGSSSGTSSSSSNASAVTSTPAAGGFAGAPGSRFAAFRECLQKNGITLPKRTPGQRRRPGSGGFFGGGTGPRLPQGVTRAQYEAAVKKCGGGAFPGRGGGFNHFYRFNSPAYKQALTKFAACMRENGVNLPTPNTSGKGPIFDTNGIDIQSPQFRAAEAKCRTMIPRPPAGPAPGDGSVGSG
jgi:hypothetical protein